MFCSIDIETTGLSRYKHDMTWLGAYFVPDDGKAPWYWLRHRPTPEDIRELHALCKELKVKTIFQNGKFDTLWMHHKAGVMFPIHYDVMLMGTAYDLAEGHALDDMALTYLGIPSWDIPKKQKLAGGADVEAYLRKDLEVPYLLYVFFSENMKETQWRVYNRILHRAYMKYRKVELRGIYFDTKALVPVKKKYAEEQERTLKILASKYPDVNWASPKQVQEVLFVKERIKPIKKTDSGAPSADAKVLKRLAAQGLTLPQQLLDYKFYYGANTKFLNAWGDYAAYDGRIHPNFKLTTVVTGRTSCSDPNLQQVPRNKELRTLFTAPKGRVLIEADYSQIELRIAADYSNDPTMIEIFRTGGDIHTETARTLVGGREPTKTERGGAKAVNFGYIYGMGEDGFVEYAFDTYSVVYTKAQAKIHRDLFFSKYGRLLEWHKEMANLCSALGGVENRFGRFRKLPLIYSQNGGERNSAVRCAINTPVQSTASDLLLMAMVEIDDELCREFNAYVVGTIHDSILIDAPDDENLPTLTAEIKRIMANPKILDEFGIKFKVPLAADIGIGAWGAK